MTFIEARDIALAGHYVFRLGWRSALSAGAEEFKLFGSGEGPPPFKQEDLDARDWQEDRRLPIVLHPSQVPLLIAEYPDRRLVISRPLPLISDFPTGLKLELKPGGTNVFEKDPSGVWQRTYRGLRRD